jgi:hypothetical protein
MLNFLGVSSSVKSDLTGGSGAGPNNMACGMKCVLADVRLGALRTRTSARRRKRFTFRNFSQHARKRLQWKAFDQQVRILTSVNETSMQTG